MIALVGEPGGRLAEAASDEDAIDITQRVRAEFVAASESRLGEGR